MVEVQGEAGLVLFARRSWAKALRAGDYRM